MNAFDEMKQAMNESEARMRAADQAATDMARMLVGRCRKVNRSDYLIKLKRELRDLDMRTGKWNSR